jgi:hypothetical protein
MRIWWLAWLLGELRKWQERNNMTIEPSYGFFSEIGLTD